MAVVATSDDLTSCEGIVTLYVIYDHPKDFPDYWIVRKLFVRGTAQAFYLHPGIFQSLEEARKSLRPGLTNLGRWADDDPAIAEVWI